MLNKKLVLLIVFLIILIGYLEIKNNSTSEIKKIQIKDYNLQSAEDTVNEKWYKVENEYQTIADLIPEMTNIFKVNAPQEEVIIEDLMDAVSLWTSANTVEEKIKAAREMDFSLTILMITVDNYPQLKKNESFVNLSYQLQMVQNRTAVVRLNYNIIIRDYDNAFKNVDGYRPKPFFKP